jgi:LPS export ABC transporter protein LptC
LGGVYFNYFSNNNKISLENNEQKIQTEIDTNKPKKKETKNLSEESSVKTETNVNTEVKEVKEAKHENVNLKKKIKPNKPEIDNVVKDIEYLTTDKNGNKYKILATSGRTNSENKNILDLNNVRGVITSDEKSTVYILSDFAEYNSSNLNSNFYQNVVINYEDKEITCDYLDVDMQTNIAIAYNNVVVTDPQSIMKAGKIILNIETKVININPDNKKNKVTVTIN